MTIRALRSCIGNQLLLAPVHFTTIWEGRTMSRTLFAVAIFASRRSTTPIHGRTPALNDNNSSSCSCECGAPVSLHFLIVWFCSAVLPLPLLLLPQFRYLTARDEVLVVDACHLRGARRRRGVRGFTVF